MIYIYDFAIYMRFCRGLNIGGINDYNLSIYPYSILIIYTNNGRIYTCPDLAEGGKDIISERIYEIIYQTGSDSD